MSWETLLFFASLAAGGLFLGLSRLKPERVEPLRRGSLLPALVLSLFAVAAVAVLAAVGPAIWLSAQGLRGEESTNAVFSWRLAPFAMAVYYGVAIRFYAVPTFLFFLLYHSLSGRMRFFSTTRGLILVAAAVSLLNDFVGKKAGVPPQGGAAWLLLGSFLAALSCLPALRNPRFKASV